MPDESRKGVPAPDRLKKRAEFIAARNGEKRRGALVLVEVRDRGDDARPRVGFTVTKKAGNAVQRNRIRRRLREAVRVDAARDMQAGTDYVIHGRAECLGASFETICAELRRRITAPAPRPKARPAGPGRN